MGEYLGCRCYNGSLGAVIEHRYTQGFTRLLKDTGEFFEFPKR